VGAVVGVAVGVSLALISAALCTFGLQQAWVEQRRAHHMRAQETNPAPLLAEPSAAV
jgi:hypothetical protein